MGTAPITGVVAEEGRYREASAFVVLDIGRRLRGKAARMRALVGMRASLGIKPGLRGKSSGNLDQIGDPVLSLRGGHEHGKQ